MSVGDENVVFSPGNAKQQEFIDAAFSGKYTMLMYGGAIRGGKTFVALAILILLCKIFPKSRWAVVRKDNRRLKENTRPSLDKFLEGSGWTINEQYQTFTDTNGSKIIFKGENYDRDKELDSFKGLEVNGFVFEEINECREQTLNKALERAGSYIITPKPDAGQPPPLIICTCNPTQGWVKDRFYNPWKNGKLPAHMFYLPAFVTDNIKFLPPAYLENLKNLPLYEYEVFVLGNWDITLKTKNAFWHAIDAATHIKPVFFNENTTIHISIDANVMPYCSATIWQVYPDDQEVHQVHEITARDPDNQAKGLARQVVEYLESVEYNSIVYMYGDATTKNQNAIDEKKRSFYDIFIEEIQRSYHSEDYIARANPQIAKTAAFVNACYAGYDDWKVVIGEHCKESISDYLTVKTDMDGTMLKKKITDEDGNSYEEYGHLSDTKRYFFYKCLEDLYYKWQDRYSEPSESVVVNVDIGKSF